MLALVLATSVSLYAGDQWMTKLKTKLGLSDEQVAQLEKKFEALQPLADRAKAIKTELKTLEAAANPDQNAINARKVELERIKKEWHQKSTPIFRSVLTKEQFARLEEMEAHHKKEQAKKQ
jgi:Spy/CpxP family protein refolding chaperone